MIRFRFACLVGIPHTGHCVSSAHLHQEAHSVGLVCPTNGNIISDHLVRVMSSGFLPVKLLRFHLQLICN